MQYMKDITNPVNYREVSETLIDPIKGRFDTVKKTKYQNLPHSHFRGQSGKQITTFQMKWTGLQNHSDHGILSYS